MIRVYGANLSQVSVGLQWLRRFQNQRPYFVCVLGFTDTALIPGISAAGATPSDRQTTALADAEFLVNGPCPQPTYPLPPLTVGISPTFISRAVIQRQAIPLQVFNAGLLQSPPIPHVDLAGQSARCVSTGQALDPEVVKHLFQVGLDWGDRLTSPLHPSRLHNSYLIISECVVGGTTTALAVLTGLGHNAKGKVNSSHADCNHTQKWDVVSTGLSRFHATTRHPQAIVAAVGDPMQPVVAGMAIAASCSSGVLLAGGTQMLAVYALMQAWAERDQIAWNPDNVVVGTTRWVTDDPTGDTVGLARDLGAPLIASQLSFQPSRYPQLQIYEQGFVKEGVGAGGCAIAANLYQDWSQTQTLEAIESLVEQYQSTLI
ncbi:MAG: TIGR00303 family protein [Cyanothece sp. SIO2G6]|nr:TIGR00303 family protein [Cyanothece sp. SIO2G6]